MEQGRQENMRASEEALESKTENIEIAEEKTTDKREIVEEKTTDKEVNAEEKPADKDKNVETPKNIKDQTVQTEDKKESPKLQTEKKASTESVKDNAESAGKPAKKKKKNLIPVCILLVLLAVGIGAYSAIAFSYKDKFLPGTWINGVDCTEMDGAQVAGFLENQLQQYRLEITGRDYASGDSGAALGQITAQDIHLTYSGNSWKAVDELLAEQDIFSWIYRKMSDNTYSFHLNMGASYDEEQLRSIVKNWEACQSDNMVPPQNAYISDYSEKLKGYEVIPEVEGTRFDVQRMYELVNLAILSQETSLDLETEGCYEAPAVRQDAAELTEPVETANKWLGARITYDWNGAEVIVDIEQLKDWVSMEKEGPVLDEKAVKAFVKEQAEEYDTYGKRRSFMTTLGVELSLPSGYYGWLTDKEAETAELIELIRQGRTVSREPVYASSARQKGMSDIGNSYVEVDLTHQHLYLYEGGTVIFETDFVSGSMSSTPDCVTPEGVFGISYKTTNAVLRGADYETPVNYWMPFYGNYGLHDATWRSEFGGQIYINSGSHGCVNLPLSSAATIYEHVSTGFPVICYYYQVDPLADQYVDEGWNGDDGDDEE